MGDETNLRSGQFNLTAWIATAIAIGTILISVGQLVSNQKWLTKQVDAVRTDVVDIRKYIEQRTDDRYKPTDAARDFQYIDSRLKSIEDRLARIEGAK